MPDQSATAPSTSRDRPAIAPKASNAGVRRATDRVASACLGADGRNQCVVTKIAPPAINPVTVRCTSGDIPIAITGAAISVPTRLNRLQEPWKPDISGAP